MPCGTPCGFFVYMESEIDMDRHPRETYQTVRVAVWIPLLQAIASGALLGLFMVCILYFLGVFKLILAAAVASLVASVVWISGLRWWRGMAESIDNKLEIIPDITYLESEPEPYTVRIEMASDNGRVMRYVELPVPPNKLKALASGLLSGKSFTEAAWCGSSGIFSRAEFVQLREEMCKRGLLELNSPGYPARGYSLTRGGYAAIQYLAQVDTPPLLASGHQDSAY